MIYYTHVLSLLFDLAIMVESQCIFVHSSHIAGGKSIQYDDDCFTQHNVPECMLILCRSGLFDISSSTLNLKICHKHRDALGIYWKKTSARTSHRSKADRGASIQSCK